MKLAYWKNPHRPNADRIYINIATPAGTKVWLEKGGQGVDLRSRGSLGDFEPDDIVDMLKDYAQTHGIDLTWDDLVENLQTQKGPGRPARKTAARRSTRSSLTTAAPDRVPGADDRFSEAGLLDLSSIKVPDPVKIVIDHREPPELAAMLEGLNNVDVRVEALDLGDIVLNDEIIIERKCCTAPDQTSDFQKSIVADDKRLFTQSERIKFEPDTLGIILVEGDVFRHSPGMLMQQIDGALSFLVTIQKLSVLTTFNLNHTAYTLLKLATHHRSGLGYNLGLRATKPKRLLDNRRFVLEGLPGVNAELALALLEHFGSVQAVMNATQAELMQVKGIGEKRAQRIVEVAAGR